MGRFSLISASPEQQEAQDHQLDLYEPQHHDEPRPSALNPIYVYYHDPQPTEKRNRISIWWWMVLVVVIAHIVARFGPPAPPESHHDASWHDFFRQEGTRLLQSLVTLGSVVPHVWHWCVEGIRQEVAEKYDEWTRPPPCPIVMQQQHDHQPQFHIVGQPRAVSIVSDAIHAWDQKLPLFLLLTGTVGVGKHELAKQVARHVFHDCSNALLELDGQEDNEDLFTSRVSRHIQRQQGHGVVVILRHLQNVSSRTLVALMQLLSRHERVILLGITGVGTRTVHQYLKRHGTMNHIPQLELEMAIREEVDDYLHEDAAKYFHVIAPFVPIGQEELQRVLQLQVERMGQEQAGKQWKSLVMTDELAAALVGPPFVEYIEWKDKATGETILVFSGTGADVLEPSSPIMNRVTVQIKQCLSTATPDLVGKLDYDQTSSQGVVSCCAGSSCYESCRFSLDST